MLGGNIFKKVFVDDAENYNATRVLVIVLVLGVVMGHFPSMKIFALTPDGIFNKYKIYTILTTTFVEVNLFVGLCHVFIALFAGAFLERTWSTSRFVKFVLIVGLGSQVGVLFTMTFMYYLTFEEPYLYDPLCGFSCVAGGFTVAISQHLYNTKLPNLEFFTFQYFPLVSFIFTFFAWSVGAPHKELWLVGYGIYFGWFYLRYFDLHPETKEPGGDDREIFALANLFPPIIRIPVQIVSLISYNLFDNIGCCKQSSPEKPKIPVPKKPISPTEVPTNFTSVSVDPEYTRKRAEAIQAIEQRLALIQQQSIQKTLNKNKATAAAAPAPKKETPTLSPDLP